MLHEQLEELRLHFLAHNLETFLTGNQTCSHRELIEKFVDLELIEKSSRGLERRIKAAKLGNFSKMHEFDWEWPKGLNRLKVEEILDCDFVDFKKNVIFAGAQGIGKTMISKNIAWNAIVKGKTALFTTASKLVIDLGSQESSLALKRALIKYTKPEVLVIDELGYLSFDNKSADFLFEIINQRYENGSIVITTNLAFKDWHQVFPGAPCVTAMIDRLTHHAEIIKIEGSSWRTKDAKEQRKK